MEIVLNDESRDLIKCDIQPLFNWEHGKNPKRQF